MSYRILTKNGVDNTNIDGARNYNFNAGRRSGIVKGALNQGNFFVSSSNTIVLDTCELRLCGHRVVIDEAKSISFHNQPSVSIRYSLVAQIIVDNDGGVSFDLHAQTSSTALVQDNLDTSGSGTYELEIGRFTQLTDGTITDVVRTADLITGGAGGGNSEYIRIGTVTTNKISPELDADVDIENTINPDDNKPQTNFTFNLPTPSGTVVSVAGEEKTSINTDTTPTANSQNLVTSGGVFKYTNNISNPNLLINGDFRVNQRGQTSYIAQSKSIYTIDRWKYIGGEITVLGNGIKLTNTREDNSNGYFEQNIEDYTNLFGKTITISYCLSDGTIVSKSGKLPDVEPSTSQNLLITNIVQNTASRLYYFNTKKLAFTIDIRKAVGTTGVIILWAKLEIGNVATSFSPRPYAEELAMCKRYYQKIYSRQISGVTNASEITSTLAYACINYEVEMRTIGTRKQINVLNIACQPRDTVTTVYKQNNIGLYFSYVTTKGGWFAFKDFPSLPKATPFFVGGDKVSQDEVCLEIDAEIY